MDGRILRAKEPQALVKPLGWTVGGHMQPQRDFGVCCLGLQVPYQLRPDTAALVRWQEGQIDHSDFGVGVGNHEAADGGCFGQDDPPFGKREREDVPGDLGTELLSDEHVADGAGEASGVEFLLSRGGVELGQKRLILRGFWPKRRMAQAHC